MAVKRTGVGDDAWPDELWFYDRANWPSRQAWLAAAFDFAKLHRYRGAMAIFNRMNPSQRRSERQPAPPVNELPAQCREKIPRRINGRA